MRFFICLAALLAACTTEAGPGTEHAVRPETSGSGIVFGKGCSTSDFGPNALIGRRAEAIPFADFPFPVRVVKPGMAVTMDYSEARLTVETDAKGIITRHSCG
ncbi:MAG TPA: I78 family peptidase inhibitor [Albidovulum sp.]|uniref:I78 family peptidase inhibitor n=1 Tax=Albidovulum sp. TaxID=1872424 RepID=UPI002BD301A0|nr:I78 family peptidase inhibitor [Albidovulum sp.]